MNNTKIIYIAGYGSTKDSGLTTRIQKEFPKHELLLIHDYDFNNPMNVINDIDGRIKKFVKFKGSVIDDDVIIIGQSWGGYFANYFSEKYGFPAFLINPAVDPNKSNNLSTNANLKGIPTSTDKRRVYKKLFLSDKDDVVKNEWVLGILPNRSKTMLTGEGHRISNLSPIISNVKHYMNNLQESF